jgi:serine protease Do
MLPSPAIAAVSAALLLLPVARAAAQGVVTAPARAGRVAVLSAASACRDSIAPIGAVRSPEGLALLRMQRELHSAELLMRQGGVARGGDSARRITLVGDSLRFMNVQRGVDSLLQVVLRVQRSGDLAAAPFVPVDSMARDLRGRAVRSDVEASIRQMELQIAALANAASVTVVGRTPTPAGWLGVGMSGSVVRTLTADGEVRTHCDYPVVETVDAGSPAERAGLAAGDTLLAFNGRDLLAAPVNYGQLLVPGQVVRIRVRRGARVRELPVTIAARRDEARIVTLRPADSGWVARPAMIAATPRPAPPRPGVAPTPPTPPTMVFSATPAPSMGVIAGAQLSPIDEDFAASVGLEPGVLVLRAPAGSAAASAGLRPGDVITCVNGARIRDVAPLQRAMARAGIREGTREITLSVVSRTAPPRQVLLRW